MGDLELRQWLTELAAELKGGQAELHSRLEEVWRDGQAYRAAAMDESKKCQAELECVKGQLGHVQTELRIIRRSQRRARKRRLREEEETKKKEEEEKKRSWFGWAGLLGLVAYRGMITLMGGVFILLGLLKPEHLVSILDYLEKLLK